MTPLKSIVILCALVFTTTAQAQNQELRALSRVNSAQSAITDRLFGGVNVELALTQAIPFRVFTLSNPNRMILDFRELEWSTAEAEAIDQSDKVSDLRFGVFQPGWTRLVMPISEPLLIKNAEMQVDQSQGSATLSVQLSTTNQARFDAQSTKRPDEGWENPAVEFQASPKQRQTGDRPIVIAIDPGHGGLDPGAVVGKYSEKDLVLIFAKELQELLTKTGRYDAFLTRTDDSFLSLTGRISGARKGGADVLISLHADALAQGTASGITIYTLSDKASDQAAKQLAAQLDRSDLLSGVDLTEQDQEITSVLMDLARVETKARSNDLAGRLVAGIAKATQRSRTRPQLSASFTVLKAPDIPSVLIELGFLTNKADLRNLLNAQWRAVVQQGILNGLSDWAVQDAAQARLLRK